MKKIYTFCLFAILGSFLNVKAQTSLLPVPSLKYNCNAITNSHEVTPATGSITAVITDGQSTTSYKNDASIENDATRGNVLFLPNTLDASNKGDGAAYYRSLRIVSTSSLVGTGDYTISFWTKVKTQTSPVGINAFPQVMLFDAMSSGRAFQFRNIAFWNSSKPSLRFNDGSDKDLNVDLDPASFIYNWTNYVIVKKGTTLSLYVNSVLKAQNTTYNLANTELKQLRFNGQAHGGGSLFDDIQIFQSALNMDQVVELYTGTPVSPVSTILDTFEDTDVHHLSKVNYATYNAALFSSEPEIGINSVQAGINTSNKVYKATNIADADWWGNFGQLNLDAPVTITNDNRFLKFTAYRSIQPKNFRIAVNGDQAKEVYMNKLSQDGTWETVVADLGPYLGQQLNSIVFIFSCNWADPRTGWGEATYMFDNFELSNNTSTPINVTTQAYPAIGGTISGNGIYQAGNNLSLTATANPGYTFAFWTLHDGTQVSTDANYQQTLSLTTDKNLSYYAYFKKDSESFPEISIDGSYYELNDLESGKEIFRNRTGMQLTTIPADFTNWKFARISARTTYNPIGNGEAPSFKIKPASDGTVYAMLAINEQTSNAEAWASANGWELVPVYTLSYGTNDPNKVITFYKKELSASTWYDMVFPDVFSRATIIAPSFKVETVGINDISVNKVKTDETIYTLAGTKISVKSSTLKNGIYIVKSAYSDGSSDTRKIIISDSSF